MIFDDIIATRQPPGWHSHELTAARLQWLHQNDRKVRASCAALQFWRQCGQAPCKRARVCHGDVYDCFQRHMPTVPRQALAAVEELIDVAIECSRI